ncbi:peptidylprolyl isomerase [Polaribacter sp. R77954]|uniref:peptidylprolyl isomerase n=1 Tax=Polaribacter sp. R77954 TaxID=3093870 RepID=UPI0037C89AB3
MTKIKYLFALILFAAIVYACDDNLNGFTNPYENVDYEALAISDNDTIVTFLESHYYNESLDSLQLIDANQTSLLADSRLEIIETEQNSINYKLYVFVTEEGVTTPPKGNPTEMDSIFVNRKGIQLLNNSLDTDPFDEADETWWSLANTFGISGSASTPIRGWTKGFPILKPGENITNNGPLTFQNTGKGFIFIPSGLAYPSINYQLGGLDNALFDQIIVFKVELLDFVKDTDHDNDGIPSIEEDADGDGDPTNDYSDSSQPNLPDYLNPNY